MNATRKTGIRANAKLARVPKSPIVIPDRVASRAANRWIAGENGCHISTYSVASHGYAQIGFSAVGDAYADAARIARGKEN